MHQQQLIQGRITICDVSFYLRAESYVYLDITVSSFQFSIVFVLRWLFHLSGPFTLNKNTGRFYAPQFPKDIATSVCQLKPVTEKPPRNYTYAW